LLPVKRAWERSVSRQSVANIPAERKTPIVRTALRLRAAARAKRNHAAGDTDRLDTRSSARSTSTTANPPVSSTSSVARSASQRSRGRTQSRRERHMPAVLACSASKASGKSTQAAYSPAVVTASTTAYASVVRPDDSAPTSCVTTPLGSPPPTRTSSPTTPVRIRGAEASPVPPHRKPRPGNVSRSAGDTVTGSGTRQVSLFLRLMSMPRSMPPHAP